MRPERFQGWLIDTVKNTPGVSRVQSFAEAGETDLPFGITLTRGDREERWQITHQLGEGEKHEHVEKGVADTPFSAPAPKPDDTADAWLTAAIGAAECPEIARVERWATRPQGSSQTGLTVFHHNSSRNFVRPL
ncbi:MULTISPECIES: hypothetical protein [Streptomyces]|uniref:hypothetical protein n=1 Tax=Streptomyces TaxID=1883 RepID=UPI0033A808AC